MPNEEETSKYPEETISRKIESFFSNYRQYIFLLLLGFIFVLTGIFVYKSSYSSQDKVEILNGEENASEIVAEIAGEVVSPGVYKLKSDSRIEDLIVVAEGVTEEANKEWMEKNLNRAAKLSDGQKIYIPNINEQSEVLSANKDGGYQNVSSDFSNQGVVLSTLTPQPKKS